MKIFRLKKYEIFDDFHMIGSNVEVYYFQGAGIVNSRSEFIPFNDERYKAEAEAIERFLRNPVDPDEEHAKKRLEECIRMAAAGGTDENEARAKIMELYDGRTPFADEYEAEHDCYLRILSEGEISHEDIIRFLDSEAKYQAARSKRDKELQSLVSKFPE